MQKFIKTLIGIITAAILIAPAAGLAASASQAAVCSGAGLGGGCTAPTGTPSVQTVAARSIQVFSVIIGLVAVVMILIAGLKYMTSNGDAGAVANAKNTLIYAVIGIFVAALAQGIVKFVLNKAS